VPASLFHLILRLLNTCNEPVIAASDVANYGADQLSELIGAGILRETSRATKIARPARYGPGDDLTVCETARGLFGVAAEDDYHDPFPLTEEDVKQYSISVVGLVEQIRHRNGIAGTGFKAEEGLVLVGTKQIPGVARFPVYLSLPNLGEEVLIERCLRARRGMAGALAVVLVPEEPHPSTQLQRTLDENGIRVVGLRASGGTEGLMVDWAAVWQSLEGCSTEPAPYVFRKKGQSWELVFAGQAVMVDDSKGMWHLAEVLRSPGRELMAVDLFAAAKGQDRIPLGSSGGVIDAKARREYQERAEDLKDQLDEAERNHDLGRKERIQEELDHLADQILAAQGVSGRQRQAQLDRERIRKSVSANVRRAIQSIRRHAPALADHLDRHVKRGHFLSYTGSIPWRF